MFWTDWGTNPAILKAGMDGSTPLPIVNSQLRWPNGIAVDHGASRIYWMDANTDIIETTTFDGGDRQIVSTSAPIRHPFGLDVFENSIFWSDWTTHMIQVHFDPSS